MNKKTAFPFREAACIKDIHRPLPYAGITQIR